RQLSPSRSILTENLADRVGRELAERHAIGIRLRQTFDLNVVTEIHALPPVRHEPMYGAFTTNGPAAHVSDLRHCRVQERVIEELIFVAAGAASHDPARLRKGGQRQTQNSHSRQ